MELPRLEDLLSPVTATARPSDTLRMASEHLTADEVGALVVLTHTGVAGLISERDVVRALADGADPDEERVDDWMADELVTATGQTTVPDAIELMEEAGVRHLVVTTDGGAPFGIVSLRRLVARDVILPA